MVHNVFVYSQPHDSYTIGGEWINSCTRVKDYYICTCIQVNSELLNRL